MTTAVRQGREFTGMVYRDERPLRVEREDEHLVTPVHMFDVPDDLREHAAYLFGDLPGGVWRTIGEFRYADGLDYEQAVARRIGGVQIEYGITA